MPWLWSPGCGKPKNSARKNPLLWDRCFFLFSLGCIPFGGFKLSRDRPNGYKRQSQTTNFFYPLNTMTTYNLGTTLPDQTKRDSDWDSDWDFDLELLARE